MTLNSYSIASDSVNSNKSEHSIAISGIAVPAGAKFDQVGKTKKPAYNKSQLGKDEAVANLRLFSAYTNSKKLNFNAYNEWKNAKASANVVANLFGSWWKACRAADCVGTRVPDEELTAELLCNFLVNAAADSTCNPNHRVPSAHVITRYAKKTKFPLGPNQFKRIFPKGSSECWKLIVDAYKRVDDNNRHGRSLALQVDGKSFTIDVPPDLDLLQVERTRNSNVSHQTVLDSLRKFSSERNSKRFSCYEYDQWPDKACNSGAISKKFHGWAKAMQEAGLAAPTTFIKDVSAKTLVQHLVCAAFDKECNPTNRVPDRGLLQRYGDKAGVYYTHYHYEQFFGSIRKCWDRILDWQNGRLSEKDLLSAEKPASGTKGFVHLIQSGNTDEYTIGKTTKPVKQRLKAYRTHHPDPKLIASRLVGDVDGIEKELHKKFASKRLGRTEWFRLDTTDLAYVTSFLSK